MKSTLFFLLTLVLFNPAALAQKNGYKASIKAYQQQYVLHHEVVKGEAKKDMRFFKPNATYNVAARFEKLTDSVGLIMKTSGTKDKKFFRYGKVVFSLAGKEISLTVYQSEALQQDTAYKNYLFLPFTDATSGEATYGGGRYLDLDINSVTGNTVRIDFNKAYNPYCAYASGYNCPIPPRGNDIPVAIRAGERAYTGKHIDTGN